MVVFYGEIAEFDVLISCLFMSGFQPLQVLIFGCEPQLK